MNPEGIRSPLTGELPALPMNVGGLGGGYLLGMVAMLSIFAFFALSEAALFSLQKVDREALKENPSVGPDLTLLMSRPRKLLAAILIGAEISNSLLSVFSAGLVASIAPGYPWLNVVIAAPLVIFFGDILPKTVGIRFGRAAALWVVRPLSFWNQLVSPIRWFLSGIADGALKLLGVAHAPTQEHIEEEQLRILIEQGRATGVIQPAEEEIINRVFVFADIPVSRLMTPRPDIVSISLTTPWPEVWDTVRQAGYSRVPFFQGNPDNIVGILHVKDLLRLRNQPSPNPRQLQKMLHPTMFVPPSKRAQDLLSEFRKRNQHMAMVVDEHGTIVGLITLDDLLSELVGELLYESDVEEPEVRSIGSNVWSVKAGIDIEDFEEKVGIEVPSGDYTTLAGFVLHQLGEGAKKGDEVIWDGVRYLVTGVEGQRITDVTVSMETQEEEPEKSPNSEGGEE